MKAITRAAMLALGLTGLSMTAACSGGGDEAPVETNVANLSEPENVVVENVVEPTPEPTANATEAPPVAPSADFNDTEQTMTDADATGMTARVKREEEDEAQPAE